MLKNSLDIPTENSLHEASECAANWEHLRPVEGFLRAKILGELERARPNWDRPHTELVVQKLKALIDNNSELGLDAAVLLIAAYAHDYGYVGLYEGGKPAQAEEVKAHKADHAEIGSQEIADLLEDNIFRFLSPAQKERIIHLVSVHDDVANLSAPDELVLMAVDTLAALDITVKPTFNAASNAKWLAGPIEQVRLPAFKRLPEGLTTALLADALLLIERRAAYYQTLETAD